MARGADAAGVSALALGALMAEMADIEMRSTQVRSRLNMSSPSLCIPINSVIIADALTKGLNLYVRAQSSF
jgi:hypothetical protein